VVQAGTVAVLKTFGAITAVIEKPGLYWKWIYPIQSVAILDKRTRVHDQPGAEVQTQDKFNILVHLAVGWHISDERTFISRFGSEEEALRILRPRIDDARMQAINSIRLPDIVSTDAEQPARFAAFERQMAEALQRSLSDPKAGFGVTVDFVKVRSIAFPDSVSQKVFDRMSKERQIASSNYRAQGERDAEIIKQNAEGEKQRLLADAEAEAIRLRGEGDAEAAKHFEAFKENQELANWLRKCDALRAAIKPGTPIIISTDHAPFDVLRQEAPK
ncbi:MAG: protease modulator HflC, partial [Planctomycetota bacterium]|nr:protease modulator HflC [Planctomycetota bacterium]